MDRQQEFINKIKNGAIKAQKEYGVLASLTLAQAILESGWGKASIGNNIFGIKAFSDWKGKRQLVPTTEYYNGVETHINAYFRDYDSVDESIIDHAKLLTWSNYNPVINAKDYKEACIQVQKCRYATNPNYSKLLISLIEQFGLNAWDDRPVKEVEEWVQIIKKYTSSSEQWIPYIKSLIGIGEYFPVLLVKVNKLTTKGLQDYKSVVVSAVDKDKEWIDYLEQLILKGDIGKYIPDLIMKIYKK